MYINVKMCLRYVHTGGAKCESVYLLEAPVFNYRTSYKGYFRILKGPKEILEGPKKQSSNDYVGVGGGIRDAGGVELNDADGVDLNEDPAVGIDGAGGVGLNEATGVEEDLEEGFKSDDNALDIHFWDT